MQIVTYLTGIVIFISKTNFSFYNVGYGGTNGFWTEDYKIYENGVNGFCDQIQYITNCAGFAKWSMDYD